MGDMYQQPESSPEVWAAKVFIGIELLGHDCLNHWPCTEVNLHVLSSCLNRRKRNPVIEDKVWHERVVSNLDRGPEVVI